MGTEYVVHKDPKLEVTIDEASNRFALCMFGDGVSLQTDADKPLAVSHYDILPEQAIHMAVRILKVASYWTDQSDFDNQLRLSLKDNNMFKEIKAALED